MERNVLVGQEVRADATAPLLTVTNLQTLWVNADVYEQDLGAHHAPVRRSTCACRRIADDVFPGTVARLATSSIP